MFIKIHEMVIKKKKKSQTTYTCITINAHCSLYDQHFINFVRFARFGGFIRFSRSVPNTSKIYLNKLPHIYIYIYIYIFKG